MTIAFGADHGGYELKAKLVEYTKKLGYNTIDVGTHSNTPIDYADVAKELGNLVVTKQADLGVLICRTGIGMSIAANKIPGIRAAVAYHPEEVVLTRMHNDANVLCFGADFITPGRAKRYLKLWLNTSFSNEERHKRRVQKISRLEQGL